MHEMVSPLKPTMRGTHVAYLHEALAFLGLWISDDERANQRFGPTTSAAVKRFQTDHDLRIKAEVDHATARAIDAATAEKETVDAVSEDQMFSIEGEVVNPDGTPLPRYIVRAYDRALCDWRELGSSEHPARTNDRGRYRISYDPAQLGQWGKDRADLRVEVRDPSGADVLAESPLILQALSREVVNFALGEDRYRGPDEFTRIQQALAPLLRGQDDLRCLEVADVLILAREAKIARSKVAYFVKATRWSTDYDVPAALFYGLMRRGEPTRIDVLLARPFRRLWTTLAEAKARNIVDLPLTQTLRTRLSELQQDYLARSDHPYAQLLATTELSGEQRVMFTQKLTAGNQAPGDFWQELADSDDFGAAAVTDLRAAFELQSLTGENTSLTVHLRGNLAVRTPREVATFSVAQWRDEVLTDSTVEVPDEVLPTGAAAARRAAYAQMLYRAAELRYPTPSLAGQLTRRPIPGHDALPAFFSKFPDFEFRDQRVLTFLRDRPKALDGFTASTRDELLRMEQLFHLVPPEDKLATIQPLWKAGLRSAPQVAYLGRSSLVRRLGQTLDAKLAQGIYRKAVHVTSLALAVYLRYHPQLNRLSTTALGRPQAPTSEELARAAITMPEWEELFGSPDACEVSPCDSAISPAAYLVDTLAYLAKAVDADGNNALDELLERRPDLGTLRLTCENTETLVPQIDLVNEILEAIVASPNGQTLLGFAIGETTWDDDLLAAQPEHLNAAAYEIVRLTAYPFDYAPFDLWAEEGRRYLAQLGLARDELMMVMPAKPGVDAVQIATEALGMSNPERNLICQPRRLATDLAPSWGIDLAHGTLRNQLDSVEALLHQAQIDFDRLLRLLNTRFVNPGRQISVSFAGTPCSLNGAVLVGDNDAELTDGVFRAFLDRLHRFVRLQRRLVCSEYELDGLIHALGVSDFDGRTFLPKIAATLSLKNRLRLSLPELGAWWTDLETYRFDDELPSQYESIFLDHSLFPDQQSGVAPDLRAVFALRADRLDLAITTSTNASLSPWLAESDGADVPTYTLQADYAAHLQGASRLTADDLLLISATVLPKDPSTGHVALNLANVSLLYRMASLARALDVSVTDALRLIALTGVTPLRTAKASPSPLDSLQFHDRFREIDAAPHSVEELAYLLAHESSAVRALAPASADVDAWVASITPSFVGILGVDDERVTTELKSAVTQSLGSAVGTDPAVFHALLFADSTTLGDELLERLIAAANASESDLSGPERALATVFGRLHKFSIAWNGLGLDLDSLPFVLTQGPDAGWVDIANLPMTTRATVPYAAWNRLITAVDLQASTFTSEQSLFTLMADAGAASAPEDDPAAPFVLNDFLVKVSEWTGWPLADVSYLTGPRGFDLELPTAMQDEQALVALQRIFGLTRSRGVSAEQAHAWTIPELTFPETQSIKQTLSLAYPSDRWLDVLGSIQDELRTLKRDALLGHLLTTSGFADSDAFYQHYLIDPDGSAADRTSRIVLAHSAVQLFAQRILLNLENFAFERPDAEAWQWRKKYRVWEAARKVFLWPENWLEPELRDNKSVFFKELEDALLQEDVTMEAAERIYRDYLIKLDDVSRLEILGLYDDTWTGDGVEHSALHIIGRTVDVPAAYYHRRLEDRTRWTPWERIQLDLSGDHLVPVVYNNKLHLFWPDFAVTELDEPSASSQIKDAVVALQKEIADLQNDIDANVRQRKRLDPVKDAAEILTLSIEVGELIVELREKQQELEEDYGVVDGVVHVPPSTQETFRYEIELGMAWCTHGPDETSPKALSREKITYRTNVLPEFHHFTGWVTGDNLLRIAVQTTHTSDPHVGYFYLDNTNGELHASEGESFPPQGTVSVSGAQQKFQSLDQFYFTEGEPRLDLKVSVPMLTSTASPVSPALRANTVRSGRRSSAGIDMMASHVNDLLVTEVRSLLTTLSDGYGRVHYLHQHGLGGKESSPFFFSTNLACYMVQLRHGFESILTTHTTLPRAAAPATVSPDASRQMNGAIDPTHYQSNGAEIIDRTLNTAESGSLILGSALVDAIIAKDDKAVVLAGYEHTKPVLGYEFTRVSDAYTSLFLRQVSRHGAAGLLSPDPSLDDDSQNLYRQLTPLEDFDFAATYAPNAAWVNKPYPAHEIDFSHDSPCSWSNWEVFFHIPLLLATRLMQNQRYAEARQWLHYIFDPTATDGEGPERFWRIRPFYEAQLNGPLPSLADLMGEANASFEQQIEEWERDPFQPHVIARLRISAYMQSVVMRYLTCLLEEADMLFRRDTREDIEEARLLYLLAAEILGDRPTMLPPQDEVTSTPNILLGRYANWWNGAPAISHPLDVLTAYLPSNWPGAPTSRSSARVFTGGSILDTSIQDTGGITMPTTTLGTSAQGAMSAADTLLLFGIPSNEHLSTFWETVTDRLFKIRHSMNFSGQLRQLALFTPPVDPAHLVRASAAGLSIQDILSGLYSPRSNYRFSFLLHKALELCGEARGLGTSVLAALEKQDGEQVAVLRSKHEVSLLDSMRALKAQTVDEAEASLASLHKTRESAELRLAYYSELERVSAGEQASLDKLDASREWHTAAEVTESLASAMHAIPYTFTGMNGPVPTFEVAFGGPHLGAVAQAIAGGLRGRAAALTHQASRSATMAGYSRRRTDWKFQADLAKKDIEQLDKQIVAAEIRLQIAETDVANLDQQVVQAREVDEFLRLKFTNQQLYSFMVSKLASVHFQAYEMAYQLALQAESAFYHELGPDEQDMPRFVKPDNWDSLRKGLDAGDLLHRQLRQMEAAYLTANKRELELTKHISLLQLDPKELLRLRETGSCDFHVPEALFAMDFAGHYYRRIKAVQITIPCIIGPYANVSATLRLNGSRTRRTTDLADVEQPMQDTVAAPQQAIATSTANRDGGAFELNFNDPRYLPFEGAGVISDWSLELPSPLHPFDYQTISDVIVHISYTARESADASFKTSVSNALVADLNRLEPRRLFSLRRDFPAAWNQLVTAAGASPRTCSLEVSKAFFPAFLDYEWQTGEDGSLEPRPITLDVTALTAYLSPHGTPPDSRGVVLNGQQPMAPEMGMPTFELPTSALSSTSIGNSSKITCELTVAGGLRADDWNDLYLLMEVDYSVR